MDTEMKVYNPKLNELERSALARDIVLYGTSDLQGVMEAYHLSEDELDALLDEGSLLSREIQRYKKQVDNDPKAAIRMASSEVLTHAVPRLHALIHDQWTEGKDRIKAVELVAKLADAMPKEAKGANTGASVVINMGSPTSVPDIKPVNPPVEA